MYLQCVDCTSLRWIHPFSDTKKSFACVLLLLFECFLLHRSKQTSETHLGLTMSRGTTSSPNCAHCGKPLSGTTVEWNKVMYHEVSIPVSSLSLFLSLLRCPLSLSLSLSLSHYPLPSLGSYLTDFIYHFPIFISSL